MGGEAQRALSQLFVLVIPYPTDSCSELLHGLTFAALWYYETQNPLAAVPVGCSLLAVTPWVTGMPWEQGERLPCKPQHLLMPLLRFL